MILTLVKGILIGILVSAPMGPIGVLVIQRTLNKGRWHGFFSGLGAMFSDIAYAVVTGLGLHFVTDFIEKHQVGLQLLGSAVLLIFGYFIYKSNPIKSVRGSKSSGSTFWQDFVTAFFITFSNPLIIFLFIGLFARMNFFHTDIMPTEILIGIFGVALGALAWWMIITTIFGKLRNKFNLRTLFLINRIVGGAIMVISVFGILYTSATQLGAANLSKIDLTKTQNINSMKTLTVPYLPELDKMDSDEISNLMEESAVRQSIGHANWNKFPYRPICTFDIARSDSKLYIRYFVRGNCLKAIYTKDQDPVWQDSCVEFFTQIPGEKEYYNFEFNCIGTCLASKRENRDNATPLSPEQMKQIVRMPSMGSRPFHEMQGLFAWDLIVAIPFDLLGLDGNNLPEKIKANFYKCADETSLPHYLSWNPIPTENPNFHCPEYFGEIYF